MEHTHTHAHTHTHTKSVTAVPALQLYLLLLYIVCGIPKRVIHTHKWTSIPNMEMWYFAIEFQVMINCKQRFFEQYEFVKQFYSIYSIQYEFFKMCPIPTKGSKFPVGGVVVWRTSLSVPLSFLCLFVSFCCSDGVCTGTCGGGVQRLWLHMGAGTRWHGQPPVSVRVRGSLLWTGHHLPHGHLWLPPAQLTPLHRQGICLSCGLTDLGHAGQCLCVCRVLECEKLVLGGGHAPQDTPPARRDTPIPSATATAISLAKHQQHRVCLRACTCQCVCACRGLAFVIGPDCAMELTCMVCSWRRRVSTLSSPTCCVGTLGRALWRIWKSSCSG